MILDEKAWQYIRQALICRVNDLENRLESDKLPDDEFWLRIPVKKTT